ncbi:MAG: N-acetylmuramoyl-L-alanine amidase [Saprospiraceae bacterium]|nr:N-acetylmuramoyl-L-alanine amidase [Saprospiraceae bacterium]
MMRLFQFLFIFLFSAECFASDAARFHKVEALAGDGIISMLRRYQLEQYSCNFDQFYKLNKISRKTPLIVGKSYFLPIMMYDFNGKTIRSSIGIDDFNTALRIQHYNERMHELSLRQEKFQKDKVLWVPYHELHCPSADLEIPSPIEPDPEIAKSGKKRVFPIFGDALAYTPLISNKLKGKVFYISSGHGGPDPGATAKRAGRTICEDEYAYDVSLRLCRLLVSHGATAYMIVRDPDDGIRSEELLKCDQDEVAWGGEDLPTGQKARLFQRSDIINELYDKNRLVGNNNQIAVMIHVDSRSVGTRIDAFFCHHATSESGKNLAEKLQKTFKQKYAAYQKDRGYWGEVEARDLHMLRECKPTSVFIELANIKNYSDQQRVVVEKNRQLLAEWLFEGLAN